MRIWIVGSIAVFALAAMPYGASGQGAGTNGQSSHSAANSVQPPGQGAAQAPMTDEDRANQLGDEVNKLMVKCVNLLTAQDPLSLEYCKQQRDLADQYPGNHKLVDRVLAHDEYGIALAVFNHKQEALEEFNQEIALLPKAKPLKPGTVEWSTAYWHRAMLYSQLGETGSADRDYRAAEESFRKQEREQREAHADKKMRAVLRQHAALLEKEGRSEAAQKLLAEAAK